MQPISKKVNLSRRYTSCLLLLLSNFLSLAFTQSSLTTVAGNKPIFLLFNGYYVLYSKPASPFVSPEGVTLVPLESFATLIGGKVTLSGNPPVSASITRGNKSVTITKSNNVQVVNLQTNEKSVLDFTIKIWYEQQGEIFVATDVFRDGFSMADDYDIWLNKLSLYDSESIENKDILSVPEMLPTIIATGFPSAILQPFSYKVEGGNEVELELKLWSGFDVPTEHIVVQLIGASKEGASTIIGPVIAPSKIDSPCTRNQDTFICKAIFESEYNYDYIFALLSITP
jgi:hypothetical protein